MRQLLAFLLGLLVSTTSSTTTEVTVPLDFGSTSFLTYGEYGEWAFDAASHWPVADETAREAHTLDSYDECTECGAEVWGYDDAVYVTYYDEHYNAVVDIGYDADGAPLYNERNEYTYDEDGNRLSCLSYSNGDLFSETVYALDADGYEYVAKSTSYEPDGSTYYAEYDQHGNATRMTVHDDQGELVYQETSEYEYDENGELLHSKVYVDGELSQEITYLRAFEPDYEADWNHPMRYVYYYPEEGVMQEDLCDLNGNMTSSTMTDADGNILTQTIYEYELDEDGNVIAEYESVDDLYRYERLYQPDSDGWFYCYSETIYESDGSKTVYLYDELYETLSETTYDAEGNVID